MGKRTLAESFAAVLLCENPGPDGACGKCKSCRMAAQREHPDLIYVTHEKKHISVDDIRQQVVSTVNIRPFQSKYKIYIIDDADSMNPQSQNALLKSLEEPPEFVVMLLLASNAQELLPTIRSRCVSLTLASTPDYIIKNIVTEKATVPDYRVEACVAFAQGNVGKALLLAESDAFEDLKNSVLNLMANIEKTTDTAIMEIAEEMEDPAAFLDLLLLYIRDVLLYKLTSDRNGLAFKSEAYHIIRWADDISDTDAGTLAPAVMEAAARLRANGQQKLVLENLLFKIRNTRL